MRSSNYYCDAEQDLVFDENEPENEDNSNEFQYLDDDDERDEDSDNTGMEESETEVSSSTSYPSPIKNLKLLFRLMRREKQSNFGKVERKNVN
jgi:hypothetical protein